MSEMRFCVIFTADTPAHEDVDNRRPSGEVWQETEGDNQYEVPDAYSGDDQDFYGWQKGHHRKWAADLNETEFRQFLKECGPFFIDGEGGTLTPELGFASAVVFIGPHNEDVRAEAFVTPHCGNSELVDWLREHEQSVPVCLTDDARQKYIPTVPVDRRNAFEAVMAVMKELV